MTNGLILSTVGTSLLIRQASPRERDLLIRYANVSTHECPEAVKAVISQLQGKALDQLLSAQDTRLIRDASAELNGIYGLYNNRLEDRERDIHFLIATDTAQGEATATLVKDFLESQQCVVQVYTPRRLSTGSKEAFSDGIKALLKWCDEAIPPYRESGYEVIFNLTGGFKSLQGYLNTIGMFYADRMVYIFESGDELIEIPRLPVRLDLDFFRRHVADMLLLSENKQAPQPDFEDAPEALFDVIEDEVILSVWGELVWNQVKQDLLAERLHHLPRLSFEPSFHEDFERTTRPADKVKLQEALARVSSLLEKASGSTRLLKQDGGLQYERYKNRYHEDLPIDHFRVSQSLRVSCLTWQGNLILRHYGAHDYVNDNP